MACFVQKQQLVDPARLTSITRALLNCAGTLKHRPNEFRARSLVADVVETVDAPHDIMLTLPGLVANFLGRLVGD